MKIKPLFLIAAAALLPGVQNSFAQNAPAISPTRLPLIEQEMFNDSNENFIIVDLVIDGLLHYPQGCDFTYDKGTVTFNGQEMSSKWQEKYAARMKAFLVHEGLGIDGMHSIRTTLFSVDELLDPNSTLRNPSWKFARIAKEYHDKQKADIITGMVNEHLLDTVAEYHVLFDEKGVFINHKKLEGTTGERYVALFRSALNIKPDSKGYTFTQRGGVPAKKQEKLFYQTHYQTH